MINSRRACAARVTVVGSVCVSVIKSHLTSRVSVCPETSFTYSAGNGGQKICTGLSLKPLPSKVMVLFAYLRHPTVLLQRYSAQLFDGRAF